MKPSFDSGVYFGIFIAMASIVNTTIFYLWVVFGVFDAKNDFLYLEFSFFSI